MKWFVILATSWIVNFVDKIVIRLVYDFIKYFILKTRWYTKIRHPCSKASGISTICFKCLDYSEKSKYVYTLAK